MAKSIEVDINVNNNIGGSIAQLKQLKRELKNTEVGTEEFKKLFNQIDDLEDKIKSAKNVSSDWIDSLESAGGPIGMLGAGLNKAKVATQSFGSALKATGIGLVVAAVGGLVAAFSESETAMKKLEPLFIGMQKILGGIFQVFEPLLDAFIDLALRALPYITKGISGFYSGLFALFTLVKNVGMGAGKILKGIFTLDFDALKDGYGQLTGSWNSAVEEFKEANKRFNASSTDVTKVAKKNSATRVATHKKEIKEKIKDDETYLDSYTQSLIDELFAYEAHQKKILDLEKQYATELEDLEADSEQKKLDLWYKRQKAEIDAIAKTETEKANLYALLNKEKAIKQKQIDDKTQEEADKIKKDQAAKKKAEDDKKDQDELNKARLIAEAKKKILMDSANVLGEYANILGQQTAEGKALAIAQATINAYLGISEIWKAPNPYPEPWGTATKIASTVVLGTAAFQNVQKILDVQVPGGGGGGGSAPGMTATNAPQFNVVGTSGANQIAQTLGKEQPVVRAYVVSQDVTTQQALDRNIVKSATLG